jgi:hypothetical protein
MRGTYTATYLEQVSRAFAMRRNLTALDLGGAFDLIVGTSTGAIIGCALAAKVPLPRIIALYREHGAKIFARHLPTGLAGLPADLIRRSAALAKGAKALEAALHAELGDTTLAEIYANRDIALAIATIEMSQHRSWVFKTPHLPGTNHRDDHYRLVDVCLASSAAPLFRSLAVLDHPENGEGAAGYRVFADGGLWANNPVLLGLIDALELARPGQAIEIFCMGTCPLPAGEQIPRHAVDRGLAQWRFGAEAAVLAIDAQEFAYDNMARMLARHVNRPCRVIRFPREKVPAALLPYLGLDDTRDAAAVALINQARTDADMLNSRCTNPVDEEAKTICSLFEDAPGLT